MLSNRKFVLVSIDTHDNLRTKDQSFIDRPAEIRLSHRDRKLVLVQNIFIYKTRNSLNIPGSKFET